MPAISTEVFTGSKAHAQTGSEYAWRYRCVYKDDRTAVKEYLNSREPTYFSQNEPLLH
jgi:hypothetical protein